MKSFFILNDPPCGTKRCYNALRLATALLKKDPGSEVVVFLMADAVDPGRLLQCGAHAERGGCWKGTDLAVRHLHRCARPHRRREGARRSSMAERAAATLAADKVLVF